MDLGPDFSHSAGCLRVTHKLIKQSTLVEYYASTTKNEVEIYVQIGKDVQNTSGEKARGEKMSLVRLLFDRFFKKDTHISINIPTHTHICMYLAIMSVWMLHN